MHILDYHRRLMDRDIWNSDEMNLAPAARLQLQHQISRRFPNAKAVYLVGALVGHYYDEQSDLDVLIHTADADMEEYRKDTQIVSGYFLSNTNHPVRFYLVPESVSPDALASRFGTIYNVTTGVWHGRRVTDITEMARPEAILQCARWQLYKAKWSTKLFPYKWTILKTAFSEIEEEDREGILFELRKHVLDLRKNVRNVVKAYNKKEVWKEASIFDEQLEEDPNDFFLAEYMEEEKLPVPIIKSILNKFRYADLLFELEDLSRKLRDARMVKDREKAPVFNVVGSSKEDSPPKVIRVGEHLYKMAGEASSRFLWERLNALTDLIVIHSGGYGHALDTIFKLFSFILEKNRYVQTGARQRRIVMRLYRKFYRHIDDDIDVS